MKWKQQHQGQYIIYIHTPCSEKKTVNVLLRYCYGKTVKDKCIGDDTKAAARQSPNCIKNKIKLNTAKNDFQYGGWNYYTLQCCMWLWNHDSEFTKWHHPAMWQVALRWHAMEFAQTFAKLEFYIWFRFWPHHRSRHVILHQSAKFYPNRTTLSRKNDVMSIFKMVDLSHLGFQGSNNGFLEKLM